MVRTGFLGNAERVPAWPAATSQNTVLARTYEWFKAWILDRLNAGADVDPTEAGEAWTDFHYMAGRECAIEGVEL